jgi:phage replication-related protein YjqB (UPF0714/DUF867 family)
MSNGFVTRVIVRKSLPSQDDLRDHGEHASCSPDLLSAVGCVPGQQVLVRRSLEVFAMYTLSEVRDERPASVVRMGLAGRGRIGGSDTFDGCVDPVVADPIANEADAETAGLLIERLDGDANATRFVAIAPHGGAIERHTDTEAERVAASLADIAANCWRCKGWGPNGGAGVRWHITSTDIHPASFPLLATLTTRKFTHAVAFHGFDQPDRIEDVLIGGAGPLSLKRLLRARIRRKVGPGFLVEIADASDPLGGFDLNNLVNRLTRSGTNGIQLEQSIRAREQKRDEIADAVASVYRTRFRS